MVDSKQKGARAELQARDLLKKYTNYNWERIPHSGALDAKHGLKGDLYIPQKENKFCVEVKHYKDDHLTSKFLTTDSQLVKWWEQTLREANEINKVPLLLFKFDRSKWFVAFTYLAITRSHMSNVKQPSYKYKWMYCHHNTKLEEGIVKHWPFFVAKLEDWLKYEEIEFIMSEVYNG